MKPELAKLLEDLLQAYRSGDATRIATFFEPDAVCHAAFLTEPLRGWPSIESHLMGILLPHLKDLQILSTLELGDQVFRMWRFHRSDREGMLHSMEGGLLYRFSPAGRIAELNVFMDEAGLRLLLLGRT